MACYVVSNTQLVGWEHLPAVPAYHQRPVYQKKYNIHCNYHGGQVAQWVRHQIGDQEAVGLTQFGMRLRNNSGQTVVLTSPSSKIWYWLMGLMICGWEGNLRSGMALAVHYRRRWFTSLWDQGLVKGDETSCTYSC